MKKILAVITTLMLLFALNIPTIAGSTGDIYQLENASDNNDIELFVRGGFGWHITIVNNKDTPVVGYLNVSGQGTAWGYETAEIPIPSGGTAHYWHTVITPFMVINITVSAANETLTRHGVDIFGFVILFPEYVDDSTDGWVPYKIGKMTYNGELTTGYTQVKGWYGSNPEWGHSGFPQRDEDKDSGTASVTLAQ